MKSPLSILLTAGAGMVVGFTVAAALGVRDSVFEGISRYDPKNVSIQRDFSTSYKKLGNGYLVLDAEAARDAFQQSYCIDERLACEFPDDAVGRANLAYSCGRLGMLSMSLENYAEAVAKFEQGVNVLEALARRTNLKDLPVPWQLTADAPPLTRDERAAGAALFQYWLEEQRKNLAICQDAQRAIEGLDFALAQPKERVAELLLIRGRALAKRGKHADAVATAERLAAIMPATGEQYFGAARIYALAVGPAKASLSGAAVSSDKRVGRERYAARAVELLDRAANLRFFDEAENRTLMRVHLDFLSLRDRDDFKQLLAKISASL